jgi:hypothetical protein
MNETEKLKAEIKKVLAECPFNSEDKVGEKDLAYKFIVKPVLDWKAKLEKIVE